MLHDPPDGVLRRLGEFQHVVVLGTLAEPVALRLDIPTTERTVWLHPNTAHHIYQRRGFEDGASEFVFTHLPRLVREPHFCGCDPRSRTRLDLVRLADDGGRAVFAALKIVRTPAALSGRDEIWVSTAHRLPPDFLSRKRYRDSLTPVEVLDGGPGSGYLEAVG